MSEQVQTAVMGVTGYAGLELARLLLQHPRMNNTPPVFYGRPGTPSEPLIEIHPQLRSSKLPHSATVAPFDWQSLEDAGVGLLFLALPHEQSRILVPEALDHGIRVIDLSGAWRLENAANRAVYAFDDEDREARSSIQSMAVYGMPELHRGCIPSADLIANPGCYATSVILALKPLVAEGWVDLDRGIVCDSKSGVSGAGKSPTAKTHFMYAANNLSAYGLFGHRHTGELLEQLDISREQIIFTPHLLPIPRGILSTIYVHFTEPKQEAEIEACFRKFYFDSPMVRVYSARNLPQIQYSVHTNYCDIGFQLDRNGRRCILVSCLDNLLKGAASQAIQNLNLMYGWNEAEGLE